MSKPLFLRRTTSVALLPRLHSRALSDMEGSIRESLFDLLHCAQTLLSLGDPKVLEDIFATAAYHNLSFYRGKVGILSSRLGSTWLAKDLQPISKDSMNFLSPAECHVQPLAGYSETAVLEVCLRHPEHSVHVADLQVKVTLVRGPNLRFLLKDVHITNWRCEPAFPTGGSYANGTSKPGKRAPKHGPSFGTLLLDLFAIWLSHRYDYTGTISVVASPAHKKLINYYETFGFVKDHRFYARSEGTQAMILPSMSAYHTHATRLKGVVTGRSGDQWTVGVKCLRTEHTNRLVPVYHTVWARSHRTLVIGESVYILRGLNGIWSVKGLTN